MQKFKLEITSPCDQKWDTFQPRGNNGFCDQCQKEVIDFTKFSDSEIRAFFKNRPKNVCGKLASHQVKTYFPERRRTFINKLLPYPIAAILGFAIPSVSKAQEQVKTEIVDLKPIDNYTYPRYIVGTVRNENGDALSDVLVTSLVDKTRTNAQGNYKIKVDSRIATIRL